MSEPIIARFQLDYPGFQLAVDLALPGSGVSVLFGASGSGKTTLLRCIAGLQKPAQGFLQIGGQLWQDSTRGLFLPTHKRPLGYVFQEANLFPHLSVEANLRYGLKRLKQNPDPEQFAQTLALLGIESLLDRLPGRLSGGESQRVAIARALLLGPQILLMDEPLAALDEPRKQEILPYLTQLHQELAIPVLYVTHSQAEARQLADYVLMLDKGTVKAQGTLAETLSRLDIAQSHEHEAACVWPVRISAHETDYQLTRVSFDGGTLSLPLLKAAPGAQLRVQIYARDVSIALEQPQATSILNVLPATITGLAEAGVSQSLVQLQIGAQTLLAHITRKSQVLLGLKTGMRVYAQIKGTSIVN